MPIRQEAQGYDGAVSRAILPPANIVVVLLPVIVHDGVVVQGGRAQATHRVAGYRMHRSAEAVVELPVGRVACEDNPGARQPHHERTSAELLFAEHVGLEQTAAPH